DLSPLVCAADPRPAATACQAKWFSSLLGVLRSPAGVNPLATGLVPTPISDSAFGYITTFEPSKLIDSRQ
ncbi:hypothetical protein, partial [Pseudomonas sp. N8]|uniref:hypothetical protein n=1 Tax=Pseudomonas sp. N8 TaxID=3449428 RepID=UPI003F69510B